MRTVDVNVSFTTVSANSPFSLAIPVHFDKKGTIVDLIHPVLCRESLISYFCDIMKPSPKGMSKRDCKRRSERRSNLINTLNKSRIILCSLPPDKVTSAKIANALKFIHRVEKEAGITPKTSVKLVTEPKFKPAKGAKTRTNLMFEGSIKWFRSTHTISLWALLIRSSIRMPGMTTKLTEESLEKHMEKWKAAIQTNGSNFMVEDKAHIKTTYKHWVPLMKNVDKLFPKNVRWTHRYTRELVYKKKSTGYLPSINRDGIRNIVIGNSSHPAAAGLKALMKQEQAK